MTQGLQINCDFCYSPVNTPGGLLFTPIPENNNLTKKHHLCAQCSAKVSTLLDLTDINKTGGGVYYSPPLNQTSWHTITRNLNDKEARIIIESLTIRE